MPSGATSYLFIPELLYEFRKYIDANLDLPLQNYIKKPEIKHNDFYIKENNIFQILFDNNFGSNIDTSSINNDNDIIPDVISDLYVITDNT
jgi:hypothetical protein